ncbi:hypothetical protein M413DRAFT_386763 [Hebeloma cylindrosporum]|uniref:Uncharacterized protein n=1 Tax=Hebeloma cylindrosporum TaxID=76867 RepID=A0A0C3C4B7_HEBCY|nr:hypothetical protein M413DRAFT_386763 [Hebeloma cylindrosporum h7]
MQSYGFSKTARISNMTDRTLTMGIYLGYLFQSGQFHDGVYNLAPSLNNFLVGTAGTSAVQSRHVTGMRELNERPWCQCVHRF